MPVPDHVARKSAFQSTPPARARRRKARSLCINGFQSPPPARAATLSPPTLPDSAIGFNPRRPAGGDRLRHARYSGHPVSIHAARVGGDETKASDNVKPLMFQSRRPRGRHRIFSRTTPHQNQGAMHLVPHPCRPGAGGDESIMHILRLCMPCFKSTDSPARAALRLHFFEGFQAACLKFLFITRPRLVVVTRVSNRIIGGVDV